MNNFIESIRLLRDTSNEIIKDYCLRTGEKEKDVKRQIVEIVDCGNLKIPIDYYVDYYNYCINNLKK